MEIISIKVQTFFWQRPIGHDLSRRDPGQKLKSVCLSSRMNAEVSETIV